MTAGGELAELSRDAGTEVIAPKAAFFADSEEEVAAAAREAESEGLAITPRGAGTGIPTQSVGRGAVILQTGGSVSLEGDNAVCSPGVVKAELNRFLVEHGRWVPVDPSSYASCTVGGMVANNSSGSRSMKYGSILGYVGELRVVIPGEGPAPVRPIPLEAAMSADRRTRRVASLLVENQKVIEEEKPKVTKNSSGYRLERVLHGGVLDLPKLFVGSEGTLAITTRATLATVQRPDWRLLFIVETSLADLDGAAGTFRALGPTALELVDKSVFRRVGKEERVSGYSRSDDQYMLFCEFDGGGTQEEVAERVASSPAAGLDPIVLSDPSDVNAAWEVRNETLALAQDIREGRRFLVPGVEDLVAPPDRLGDLVSLLADRFDALGLGYVMYGHAGDANLHARPMIDLTDPMDARAMRTLMEDCFEEVWKMGGSMTGEHGDGRLRAEFVEMQYPETYWIMEEVKGLFDPRGLMNPGVKIARPARP